MTVSPKTFNISFLYSSILQTPVQTHVVPLQLHPLAAGHSTAPHIDLVPQHHTLIIHNTVTLQIGAIPLNLPQLYRIQPRPRHTLNIERGRAWQLLPIHTGKTFDVCIITLDLIVCTTSYIWLSWLLYLPISISIIAVPISTSTFAVPMPIYANIIL